MLLKGPYTHIYSLSPGSLVGPKIWAPQAPSLDRFENNSKPSKPSEPPQTARTLPSSLAQVKPNYSQYYQIWSIEAPGFYISCNAFKVFDGF